MTTQPEIETAPSVMRLRIVLRDMKVTVRSDPP